MQHFTPWAVPTAAVSVPPKMLLMWAAWDGLSCTHSACSSPCWECLTTNFANLGLPLQLLRQPSPHSSHDDQVSIWVMIWAAWDCLLCRHPCRRQSWTSSCSASTWGPSFHWKPCCLWWSPLCATCNRRPWPTCPASQQPWLTSSMLVSLSLVVHAVASGVGCGCVAGFNRVGFHCNAR